MPHYITLTFLQKNRSKNKPYIRFLKTLALVGSVSSDGRHTDGRVLYVEGWPRDIIPWPKNPCKWKIIGNVVSCVIVVIIVLPETQILS